MINKVLETVEPFKEVADFIKESGGETFKSCFQCGLCETYCPWNRVRKFFIRKNIHEAQLGLSAIESEDTWLCATCGNCVQHCPRGVNIIDVYRALRRIMIPDGTVPPGLPIHRSIMTSFATVGNPFRQEPEDRTNWAKGLGVKDFSDNTELLYFPCCTTVYDSRVQNVAQATSKILTSAGKDYGILGSKEVCCGESVRKWGNETLFRRLARQNIKNFIDSGVKKILVSSPHCFHTFKNEYPEFRANFDVIHTSQYLFELIKDGKLEFTKEFAKKVAYHDPCYLGRHNNIYDEPREVLKSIPGLELVEMADTREHSLCCGGGGGRIWLDTPVNERFSGIRIEQAIEAGAEVLAVACPYCMVLLKDSVIKAHKEDVIKIMDIAEIVHEAI